MLISDLKLLLDYNPTAGTLKWKERRPKDFLDGNVASAKSWNTRHAGKDALTKVVRGERRGKILGKQYLAHRVAYAIHHGEWPDLCDAVDGDKTNIKADNLTSISTSDVALAREQRKREKESN